MKKKIALILCSSLLFCAGCSQASAEEKMASPEKNIIDTVEITCVEMIEVAQSFEELCNKSDFIAEVKITEASPYFTNDGSDRVFTEMTPEIIEIYKGEYNGEKLGTCGGLMKYTDYTKRRRISDDALTEEERENGYVYYNWLNNKIPEVGDTVIFFGTYSEDNNQFMNTYGYQGIYFCEGEKVTSYSLNYQWQDGWKENLILDYEENFGAESTPQERTLDVTIDKSVFAAALQ